MPAGRSTPEKNFPLEISGCGLNTGFMDRCPPRPGPGLRNLERFGSGE
jgi:hypothetical protein